MITVNGVDPKMIANNLEPAHPTHPGLFIKNELVERGISQKQLADKLGISPSLLSELLNGKRALNAPTALLVEAALGLPAAPLLSLQSDYNMLVAMSDRNFMQRLKAIRSVAAF